MDTNMDKDFNLKECERYLTKFSERIGMDGIIDSLDYLNRDIPIISVGSGNAAVEKIVQIHRFENGYNDTIICVDPDPKSYDSEKAKIFIEPQYKYLDDVDKDILENPNKILFLVAPYPNNSSYDWEAIIKYDWAQIFLIVERTGGAGGNDLLAWLYHLDPNVDSVWTFGNDVLSEDPLKGKYGIKYQYRNNAKAFLYELLILEREYVDEKIYVENFIAEETDPCIIS